MRRVFKVCKRPFAALPFGEDQPFPPVGENPAQVQDIVHRMPCDFRRRVCGVRKDAVQIIPGGNLGKYERDRLSVQRPPPMPDDHAVRR